MVDTVPEQATDTVPEEATVVIVGGGFAGLSAALKLKLIKEAFPDDPAIGALSYLVLEADAGHLGGRTETRHPSCDFGAGYVGQSQNYIQFLIRLLQIQTEPTHLERTQRWLYHTPLGGVDVYPGDNPLNFPGVPNALYGLGAIDAMVLEVRRKLHEPWSLPLAPVWDSITVRDWITGERIKHQASKGDPTIGMSAETERVFTASVRAAFSLEPEDISFFFLLYYAAAAGSYSALVDIAGGDGTAEGTRFKFGTANIVDEIAKRIGKERIRWGQRVTNITRDGDRAVVTTASGATFYAARVIVALSPPTANGITFSGLPRDAVDARIELGEKMSTALGQTIKCFVHFKAPVWRQRGLMGYMLSMAEPYTTFPVGWTLDNCWVPTTISPEDEHREPRFTLMAFIGGDAAEHWATKTPEARGEAVIRHLQAVYQFENADLYGDTLQDNYEERNWPVQQAGGQAIPAPAAMMPTGILSVERLCRALRTPIGPVYFAGTETALEWCGYLNGAVESGFRAMGEVLEGAAFRDLFLKAAADEAQKVAGLAAAAAAPSAPGGSSMPPAPTFDGEPSSLPAVAAMGPSAD